jgi:hypothetical protein
LTPGVHGFSVSIARASARILALKEPAVAAYSGACPARLEVIVSTPKTKNSYVTGKSAY